MKKKWAERLFSLLLMALAVSAYWQTIGLPRKTGLITGPAFFPQWLAILLFVCSAIPFARTLLDSTGEGEAIALPVARVILKLITFLAFIAGALIIIPYTGWLGAQFIMVFIIEMVLEKRKWTQSLAIAIAGVVLIYALFELGLGVRLPRGIFE
jgi:hypothetical protein